jgi:transcription initiation factor TFIIIB Brf1 subunit/transcription initiation factor TFIIB
MICPECGSENVIEWVSDEDLIEYKCKYCGMIFEG